MPSVIIIMGPPGAGKETQAELLVKRYRFFHIDNGKTFVRMFKDPKAMRRPDVKRQRALYLAGELMDSDWVNRTMRRIVRSTAKSHPRLVLTGSPRTVYEAFGDGKKKGYIHFLERIFKRVNLAFVWFDISQKESVKRNSLRGRDDDKPGIIRFRYRVYRKRTFPLLEAIRKRKYPLFRINGEATPDAVHRSVVNELKAAGFLGGKKRER